MNKTTLMERADRLSLQQWPSMKEWILSLLHEHGLHTLDELGVLLPRTNWAQLFLAIDGLSRDGAIDLRWLDGDYWVNVRGSG